MKPFVSVIMPVYNASRFLIPAMDSVLNQSFTDFEFIIIDDGSTDNSAEIIKSFTDARIKYFHQSNSGVASALNFALLKSKGVYIWRHDADDICEKNKLDLQLRFLEKHPEFSLCATQVAFMTSSGKIAKDFKQPSVDYFQNEYYRIVERSQFNPYSPITHATVLVRRSVVQDLGGYREYFETAEDVDLWLRLIQKFSAAVINECSYYVRLSPNSATATNTYKNEFYRNKAFEFYGQRSSNPWVDNLMLGLKVPKYINISSPIDEKSGFIFRNDLLFYKIPLYKNAGDLLLFWKALALSLFQGRRLISTWKRVLIILLGERITSILVKVKSLLKW